MIDKGVTPRSSHFLNCDYSLPLKANDFLLPAVLCLLTACSSGTGGTSSPPPPGPTVAAPTFTPGSNTHFAAPMNVSIADATPGASIHYTTDGSAPTTSSPTYSGPFKINGTTMVSAIGSESGDTTSPVSTAIYTYAPVTNIVSDNFDEPALNTTVWKFENPLGDGTVTMNGSAATLNVPMGANHDLWVTGNNSVRIMQPVANGDFSVDVRFQSAVEMANQDEGIVVAQDSIDFLRFDVVYQPSQGPTLFAAGLNGPNDTIFVNTPIALAKGPLVLRLSRSGNVWTGSWSTDGQTFTSAPSFTFNLNVTELGPFAGTANDTPSNSPGFTATVDYFFSTASPIANNDGPLPYSYATVDPAPAGTLIEKTLADIEGTGHLDAVAGYENVSVAGNNSNSGIYWYKYPASGNVNDPWIKYTIVSQGNAYEDMLAYDVNGDGAVDIICSFDPTFSGSYTIVWFENPRGGGGNPATDPWVMHVIGPSNGENNLQLADIDGDGRIDVITPTTVFFQNSPTSWTPVQYSTSFRGVSLLDIGSGKGAINMVGTQPGPPYNIVWWENPRETSGNARTGTWIMRTIGPGYPCNEINCSQGDSSPEVAVYQTADVNGDGMNDVISAQSEGDPGIAPPPGGLIWWQAPADRRNGTWIKHTIDANVVDVHKIAIGDMDKNGTQDIVVAEQDQSPLQRVIVYYNDGKGNLTPQVISNAKGHNLCIGNVNGNAKELDILNSGHGFYNDSHPLQIFFTPY